MQNKLAELDAPEHHADNLDRPVVPEPSVRVEKMEALLAAVQAAPQVPMPVEVGIVDDAYIRAGWVKAGTVVVGHLLNEAVPLVLLKGEAIIAGAEGAVHVTAPYVAINQPGTRRAMYAVTDCYALNAIFAQGQTVTQVEERIIGDTSCLDYQQQPSSA